MMGAPTPQLVAVVDNDGNHLASEGAARRRTLEMNENETCLRWWLRENIIAYTSQLIRPYFKLRQ